MDFFEKRTKGCLRFFRIERGLTFSEHGYAKTLEQNFFIATVSFLVRTGNIICRRGAFLNVMPNSERGVNLLPILLLRLFRAKRLVPEKMKGTGYFFL